MNYALKASALALTLGLATTASPAWADFWSDAGAKFKGVTLHGVTESTPPSNYIRTVLAPEFEKKTGIKVDIETTSWDQMYDKAIKDMEAKTGIYDMVYIEQDIIYSYLARNFLVDITKTLKEQPDLKAPTYDDANFTSFADYFKDSSGDLFGVPMEAFLKAYLYRKDLFDDPKIKEAFKKETGKDLKPATTHAEYTEIAEFFTKYGKDNGMELWGTTAQAHTGHPASWYEFFESIAPTFGVYNWGIDAKNNYAATVEHGGAMNGDKAKAALKYWLHLRDIAPPESTQSTWTETATTFAAGRVAQGLIYGENAAWIASDPAQSKVVGQVGFALPPLEPGVLDDAKAGKGYIGYYDGGAFGVPVTSKNKEASLLFLEFIGQNEVQPDWAIAAPRITNTATFDDPKVKEMDVKLGGFYTMLKDDGKLFAGAPPYPFHAQVREATAPIFYDILTGNIGPDEGLDQMAAKAEEELTSLGYRK
ncbi:extracellular solute-binding protein [Rhizobium leguminosarum]|uniref:extracellular solute-binding protein n=1 Tax=Rhizobium TaxID=379 RepID=UPI001C915486|nr:MULTISPECIES: extracellular solute-binding protein [Rhizobium]MBY3052909.1 extracellular solute-binding protein [Rhizobium laguerreae]MBY3177922.1 extracellular solute-binding protein [Rhizobium leguminosarum]MBY5589117.1 extracellular solute-binding protein [Rhizobium leguminosarum]MBY5651477.1 extracellular solute-binding protein [Rhizobium leguminosarum]MBY5655345.1 extracellular solute-binding protein [Rhizobium leguminosarum]